MGSAERRLRRRVDVPGVERRHGFLEPRVRTERGERVRQLDMLFQPGPRVKAVFARDDELRVGERERRVEYGLEGLAAKPRMVSTDPGRRGEVPVAMRLVELVRLDLELREVRTWR